MSRIRPALAYQHPRAPIRLLADDARPKLKRAFRDALRLPAKLFDVDQGVYLIRNGRLREVATMVDWSHYAEAMKHPVGLVADVWLAGGAIGRDKINTAFRSRARTVHFRKFELGGGDADVILFGKDFADRFNYDRFDAGTQQRLRAYQDLLIRGLEADARNTIQAVLIAGLNAGLTAEEIAQDIVGTISLTANQAQAVLNYRRMVEGLDAEALSRQLASPADAARLKAAIAAGTPLDQAVVDAMVQRYEDNYLDLRAQTIAQTEATRAASLGLQDSYQQAVDRGAMPAEAIRQRWEISLDERTCVHCLSIADMNPDGVPFGQSFDSDEGPVDAPPLHPSCRCSLTFITNLDLVPET